MPEVMRTVTPDDYDRFHRFLERCYGHGRGAFARWQPELFREDPAADECHLILERDGEIISHVGAYPIPLVLGPARLTPGGIGNVATHPDHRSRGYMARLMEESVRRMRERGWSLSALWGDRQRYAHFGYERCGLRFRVQVSRRSLDQGRVVPAEVAEVDRGDPAVVAQIAVLHSGLPYRTERPHFGLQLAREGVRAFLGPDGYILSHGQAGGYLHVIEAASPTERLPELVRGAMDWTFGDGAELDSGPGDTERMARVVDAMCGWHAGDQGMLRIVDWLRFLQDLQPLLQHRAAGLPPFSVSVGCRRRESTDWATVDWDGQALAVSPERRTDGVEFELPHLTGLVCGGPHPGRERLGLLTHLLPVPVHIPGLDHV